MKPRLLDLFCGAGGAAVGYHRAGFDVVGVDNRPMPRYPFEFHLADAMTFPLDGFDAIHASPPCQDHSTLSALHAPHETGWMLPTIVARLEQSRLPYAVENVSGADLSGLYRLVLCGSSFNLGATCRDRQWRQLRRHRQFVTNIAAWQMPCRHKGQPIGVYGHGGGGQMTRGYKGTLAESREALETPWMNRAEVSQAIPPAYCEFIGHQLVDFLVAARSA